MAEPRLSDVDGAPLRKGDPVRYLGDPTVYVVARLDPAMFRVWLTDGDREWLAIPATLRRAHAVGEYVSVGGVPYVLVSVDPALVGAPVYGGEPVTLDPAAVDRLEDFSTDPGPTPDLSNIYPLHPPWAVPTADRNSPAVVRPIRPAGDVA